MPANGIAQPFFPNIIVAEFAEAAFILILFHILAIHDVDLTQFYLLATVWNNTSSNLFLIIVTCGS